MWVAPWRAAAACALLAALGILLVMALHAGAPPATDARGGVAIAVGEGARLVAPPLSAANDGGGALDAAARRAFDAWERFAVAGDLGELRGAFDPDGPQHALLEEQAPTLTAGGLAPPELVVTASRVASVDEGSAAVDAWILLRVAGTADRTLVWRVHLVAAGDDWLVWTVEDLGHATAPATVR